MADLQTEIDLIKAHAADTGVDLDAEEPTEQAQAYLKMIAERQAILNHQNDPVRQHLETLESELFPSPVIEEEDPDAMDPRLE